MTPAELAHLIGTSPGILTRHETSASPLNLDLSFGLQVVLGLTPRALFPGQYRKIEEAVMQRASKLDALIRNRHDSASKLKRRLFRSMVLRASRNSAGA